MKKIEWQKGRKQVLNRSNDREGITIISSPHPNPNPPKKSKIKHLQYLSFLIYRLFQPSHRLIYSITGDCNRWNPQKKQDARLQRAQSSASTTLHLLTNIVNGGGGNDTTGKDAVAVATDAMKAATAQSAAPVELNVVPMKAQADSSSSSSEVVPEVKVGPSRCATCRKRVGLTGFNCKCGNLFCSAHRYSDKHECPFDYRGAGRDAIAKANPVVKAEKLDKI
ncbi:unnamed protein product [Lactuca virosa]|uniref:AN1-type domain-containing protein n=1 Tax=Lactuca virosa TaxID=75947 RepID=A0AAU9P9S9_9ASTR|nr:unnamed protein product [Lactuca virosa]